MREYWRNFSARAERLKVPLAGSLALTHRCNLNCVHCYLGAKGQAHDPRCTEMGTSRVLSLIDEITEAGCLILLLTGGEPLLREDFNSIYRRARENGMLVTVFTNGTRVTNEILELFRELPPAAVEISLYGATAETYERITGVPGSHEQCLRGVKALLANETRVNLKTILMTLNRHEFAGMEAIARKLGVRFRFDAAITPCLDGDGTPLDFRVTPEEAVVREMADKLQLKRWLEFHEKVKDSPLGDDLYTCGAGRTCFHVDASGRLQPCLMTGDIGFDLSEGPFLDGWEIVSRRIRERKVTPGFGCKGCETLPYCGYCPAAFRLENGREDRHSEFFCRMGRLRLQSIHEQIREGAVYERQSGNGRKNAV